METTSQHLTPERRRELAASWRAQAERYLTLADRHADDGDTEYAAELRDVAADFINAANELE